MLISLSSFFIQKCQKRGWNFLIGPKTCPHVSNSQKLMDVRLLSNNRCCLDIGKCVPIRPAGSLAWMTKTNTTAIYQKLETAALLFSPSQSNFDIPSSPPADWKFKARQCSRISFVVVRQHHSWFIQIPLSSSDFWRVARSAQIWTV